jgi:hypothetical protein
MMRSLSSCFEANLDVAQDSNADCRGGGRWLLYALLNKKQQAAP